MSSNVAHSRRQAKNKWSSEEDEQLRTAVHASGTESWGRISLSVPGRSGKQCRERWIGQLAPSVSKEAWTPEEDAILARNHAVTGNRWTTIASQLPGRSGLQAKNRWNWLKRHDGWGDPAGAMVRLPKWTDRGIDIIERKPPQMVLEPIAMDDGLFGAAFQQFQAKMFLK
jgi:hypothetical protein